MGYSSLDTDELHLDAKDLQVSKRGSSMIDQVIEERNKLKTALSLIQSKLRRLEARYPNDKEIRASLTIALKALR